jgi:hypothetical protein
MDFCVAFPVLVSVIGMMSPPNASTAPLFLMKLVTLVPVHVAQAVVVPSSLGMREGGGMGAFP